mmetsp:Transcript_59147/g.157112  ORF Transcript_59147/g.157112 Transcript_59147/m.157112 type:complete len:170 (-) Transcript_59147:1025-1534(-)
MILLQDEMQRAKQTLQENKRLEDERRISDQRAAENEERRMAQFAEEKERKMRLRAEREAEVAAHKAAIRQRMVDRQVCFLSNVCISPFFVTALCRLRTSWRCARTKTNESQDRLVAHSPSPKFLFIKYARCGRRRRNVMQRYQPRMSACARCCGKRLVTMELTWAVAGA